MNPYQDDIQKTRTNPWHSPTTFAGAMERSGQQDRERARFEDSLRSSYPVPRTRSRSSNDVAMCTLVVGVVVTWSLKRLCGWTWDANWQALAITAIVTMVIARVYFERHLLLARRIVMTLGLAIVAVIAYGIWSLSRH